MDWPPARAACTAEAALADRTAGDIHRDTSQPAAHCLDAGAAAGGVGAFHAIRTAGYADRGYRSFETAQQFCGD